VHAVREVHDPSLFDHSGGSIDSLSLSESPKVKFAVIANPLKRCGVHLTAVQQARVLNCPLLTEPLRAENLDFAYVHWHPNFLWQHPNWVAELKKLEIPIVLIVHDYIMVEPVKNSIAFVAFDRRLFLSAKRLRFRCRCSSLIRSFRKRNLTQI
jgi:hypothetical protein